MLSANSVVFVISFACLPLAQGTFACSSINIMIIAEVITIVKYCDKFTVVSEMKLAKRLTEN